MLVNDFLSNSAARYPEKEFCVCAERRLTYAEVEAESNRLAHALLDAGVERGDRVAVFLENRAETVISIFGILKAGAAFVLINPTTKPDKLCYILNDCAAAALITGGASRAAIEETANEGRSVRCLVTCGPAADVPEKSTLRRMTFEQDVSTFSASPPPGRCIDMDLAAIIYTSGSTGRPKGVVVTHLNVVSAASSITQYLENVPEDIILGFLPLSFDYGLYQVLMAAKTGATVVLEKSFAYPYHIIQRVKEEKVTGFPGVPTAFAVLLQMKDLDPAELDGVRYVTNTAAALPAPHILRLRTLFRKARIFSMYGVTESKRVSYLPPEQLDIRPTSVGRGMPNEEVYIVDEEGKTVGPGVVGELVVRGSNVMQGYWGLPDETARALRPGRYPWEKVLYTGDLFKMDDEGYLYFVARKDDIIKSRGEKVSPREVENAICELPEVLAAAVVGVPDAILGEAVKAVVVRRTDSNLTDKDIIGHCARRLENFMVPKYVEFRADLPKTATGKVKRMALLEDPARADEGGGS
jgi:amino acid adenylation domain-containing protein